MKRFVRVSLVLLAVVVAGVGAAGFWVVGSLPQTDGTIALTGLQRPVQVDRDAHGIPTIRATSEHDAYFALGFVHAQDRLWQMEMHRRAGAGRLAELFGEAAVGTDRFMRTLGLYRLAEASFAHLDAPVQAALRAYADGVNAYLAHHPGVLPPEFLLLGHRPEPWQPADSLVWGRLMGLQLAGNWREELVRLRVSEVLTPAEVEDLWPPYPDGAPVTVTAEAKPGPPSVSRRHAIARPSSAADLDRVAAALLDGLPEPLRPRLASNVWALAGTRTASGRPLLANDPHLGFGAPILWYLASIETPDFRVTGATVPGVPFHLLGHNGRVAWGITTTHSDLMDLFVERPAADGGYLAPEGTLPFRFRNEIIKVDGGPEVHLTVRETRHGPVISDALPGEQLPGGEMLALASATLAEDDRTAQAFYYLARAGNWQDFQAALTDFHSPQQNFAYADADGIIGFFVPGRVPLRRAGDGTLPRPGWTGEWDWTGWAPFAALPREVAPPSGRIVNANNRVVPDGYPYLLSAHWPEPFRAARIIDLLDRRPRHDPASFQALQMDELSPVALAFRDRLAGTPPSSEAARRALALLAAWDGRMDRERPEPLIIETWLLELQREVLKARLGTLADSFGLLRPLFLQRALDGGNLWCGEDACAAVAARALDTALAYLRERHGDDMAGWRWGDAHRAVFEHSFLRNLPVLDRLSRLEIATGGGDFTVNRGTFYPNPDEPFLHRHGPGLRAVYDLADLSRSRFMIATGQSGNPLSPHYRDLLAEWRDGRYLELAPDRPVAGQLRLEPVR